MAKITRKSYQRKKIIMGVTLFGAVGLVSTGFAAWVLSAGTEHQEAAQLSVGQVTDKNMEFQNITVKKTGTENDDTTYHFEPLATDAAGRVRYDGANAESLSLTVAGEITQAQNLGTLSARLVVGYPDDAVPESPVDVEEATENFESAVSKGYIVAPEAYKTEKYLFDSTDAMTLTELGAYVAPTGESTTGSFHYEVKFAWGAFFGGINPADFFDSEALGGAGGDKAGSAYTIEEVNTILTDLHNLLDTVPLALTLTANPN